MGLTNSGGLSTRGNKRRFAREGLIGDSHQKGDTPSKLPINLIVVIVILLIALYFVYTLFIGQKGNPSKNNLENLNDFSKLTETQVLKTVSGEKIIKDFIVRNPEYKTKITYLDTKTVESLALTEPAIYKDLVDKKGGIYKIEYISSKGGLLILLDPKEKIILKYYRVKTMHL